MSPAARPSRAFTLIELIVVIVLMSIAAAVVAPRLARSPARETDRVLRSVAAMLSVAAHRDGVGGRMSVAFDPARRSLVLESIRVDSSGTRARRPDPIFPPAPIAPLSIRSVLLDGTPVEPAPDGGWRIDFPEHAPRPFIEIHLESADLAPLPPVRLLPGSIRAMNGASPYAESPVDLDATGAGRSPW